MALWIDSPDALEKLERLDVPEEVRMALRGLIENGIAVLRGVHDVARCDAVIADYREWSEANAAYVKANLDVLGRPKRLVNFHLYSKHALAIGTDERVHRVLDAMFAQTSALYTSLTFNYGTQQPVHRDTPHFATWPGAHFAGVWTALEDVSPEAGPLFYHTGGHRMALPPPSHFMAQANQRIPDAPLSERLLMALDLYNGEVIRSATAFAGPTQLVLNKGDVVIWHPELPHGGSPALDQMRTRWSIVCHCSPTRVQVHQHDRFFLHQGPEAPADRYGYFSAGGRQVAHSGEVSFM